jgi:hypothetical protein
MDGEQNQRLHGEPRQVEMRLPPELIDGLMQLIQRRSDLISTLHEMTDEQKATNEAFEAVGGSMAVREFVQTPLPTLTQDTLDVPEGATTARVYASTGLDTVPVAGVRTLDLHGRGHIGRIEFYDKEGDLILITGAQPASPTPAPQPAGPHRLRPHRRHHGH